MTKAEVAKLVAVMVAAFPNAKVTADTSSVYERMLADLDYPVANAAVERLLATCKFMPTVAEIREAGLTLHSGEIAAGGEAWGSVLDAIGAQGVYRLPGTDFGFRDPVTARCVSALGWEELCNSENQTADRARFIELYDKLAATERRGQLSEGLPAMQRFRALQESKRQEIAAKPIGALLALVNFAGDESL